MTKPSIIVTTIFVAMLLFAAVLCGEALTCADCGHICCAKTSVGDFFRRLVVGVVATVAVAAGALPLLRSPRPLLFEMLRLGSSAPLLAAPLRI